MNLSEHSHRCLIFDLARILIKLRHRKSPVRGGNKGDPDVDGLQRHLTTDSASILSSSLIFSANSRSPPQATAYYSLHAWNAVSKQETAY